MLPDKILPKPTAGHKKPLAIAMISFYLQLAWLAAGLVLAYEGFFNEWLGFVIWGGYSIISIATATVTGLFCLITIHRYGTQRRAVIILCAAVVLGHPDTPLFIHGFIDQQSQSIKYAHRKSVEVKQQKEFNAKREKTYKALLKKLAAPQVINEIRHESLQLVTADNLVLNLYALENYGGPSEVLTFNREQFLINFKPLVEQKKPVTIRLPSLDHYKLWLNHYVQANQDDNIIPVLIYNDNTLMNTLFDTRRYGIDSIYNKPSF